MNQTEREQWQARVEFYGQKIEQYKARHPNAHPSKSTIRRWAREFNMLGAIPTTRAFDCDICELDDSCPVDRSGKCFWLD